MSPQRPTLEVVARAAGTSVPTVSKVLRGGTDVSAATRRSVLEAVAATGYRQRAGDASRARGRAVPELVDLVLTAVDNAWATRALSGIEQTATDAGTGVVLTIARDDDWVTRLLRRRSEGAVIVGVGPSTAQLAGLAAAGVPVVLVDPVVRPPDDVPSVGSTNWEGGRSAGEHLASLGHTRIGMVDAGPGTLYNAARVDGFRSALAAAGLDLPPSRLVHAGWSRTEARDGVLPLLRAPDRPTAFFASSEGMAFGVYDAATETGLRIPQDLSVVGFDDLPDAQWASPPMTTVQQPTAEMGSVALRILLDLVDDARTGRARPRRTTRIELATHFVVRGSTAAPPSA